MSFDWKGLIGKTAPILATGLGGPLAGAAVSAISKAVLGKPDGSTDEIESALANADPLKFTELKLALQKAEQDFKAEMGRQGIQIVELDVKDRASARDLAKSVGMQFHNILAVAILSGFLIMCLVTYWMIRDGNLTAAVAGILGAIVGYWSNSFQSVVSFFFGSSQSSKDKDKTLSDSISKIGS